MRDGDGGRSWRWTHYLQFCLQALQSRRAVPDRHLPAQWKGVWRVGLRRMTGDVGRCGLGVGKRLTLRVCFRRSRRCSSPIPFPRENGAARRARNGHFDREPEVGAEDSGLCAAQARRARLTCPGRDCAWGGYKAGDADHTAHLPLCSFPLAWVRYVRYPTQYQKEKTSS